MTDASKYYDGGKLLSMKDLNGNDPEIYMVVGNRSAGKTTYFGRYLVKRFIKYNEKFALLFRFNYEMDDVADKFFKDIGALFFPNYEMTAERMSAGIYQNLYLKGPNDEKPVNCGYAMSMNNADQIKRNSHLFSDVSRIFFDEFQSETNHYCPNEIKKFKSIHISIARGKTKLSRRVPVIMCSNSVSLINPYFVSMGISQRLTPETKFLRGEGFVLEQSYNKAASEALKQSAFLSAFKDDYIDYAAGNKYLNDSEAFIQKLPENGRYLATIKYDNREYSVKSYEELGFIYVSDSVDKSFPVRLTVDVKDHDVNYLMLSRHDLAIQSWRAFFEKGLVRFKNQLCKNAFLCVISYNVV